MRKIKYIFINSLQFLQTYASEEKKTFQKKSILKMNFQKVLTNQSAAHTL